MPSTIRDNSIQFILKLDIAELISVGPAIFMIMAMKKLSYENDKIMRHHFSLVRLLDYL